VIDGEYAPFSIPTWLVRMPTYRIDLAYDGSTFRGFAANSGVRTVQGELEAVLAAVLRCRVNTVVAGRTDAGVHARGQVVSFVVPEPIDSARVQRSINRVLGPDVVALAVSEAADGFDARKSALSRSYRYSIDNGPVPDPFRRWVCWHQPHPLDLEAMNGAARAFLGEQDFASLCRAAEGKSSVRRVLSCSWHREPGDLVVLEVTATAFCHQMVRSMVAICVEAGRGRLDPTAVPGILQARDRAAGRGVAPAHGLTLWEVGY
jgi:tRNA pseudouridine38-40 synthase